MSGSAKIYEIRIYNSYGAGELFETLLNHIGFQKIVIVQKYNIGSLAQTNPLISSRGHSVIILPVINYFISFHTIDHAFNIRFGTIIHNNNFDILIRLIYSAGQSLPEIIRTIISRNNYADFFQFIFVRDKFNLKILFYIPFLINSTASFRIAGKSYFWLWRATRRRRSAATGNFSAIPGPHISSHHANYSLSIFLWPD